jgi:hypothetical protein
MRIETTCILSPIIKQYFNPKLLSVPTTKLRDWTGTFEIMWKEVLKLWSKLDNNPQRKARCESLKEEILQLYERAKIKEKEREAEKNHKTQEFGYHVAVPTSLDRDVHARLAIGRKRGSFKPQFRRNHAIHKAKIRASLENNF